jgi:hypothetical protein
MYLSLNGKRMSESEVRKSEAKLSPTTGHEGPERE